MKYIYDEFESIEQMLRTLRNRTPNKVWAGKKLDSENEGRGFSGTSSYEEAERLIRDGYIKPLEKIKRGVEVNAKGNVTRKSTIINDVIGFAPCVPNAILGLPKSMIDMKTNTKKEKIISILYDATDSGGVCEGTFVKAGIAVLTIINSLEVQGYRVSLRVTFYNANTSSDKERTFASVNLKDWRQPLDLKKMTFPFCHPSMLRRIGFKWIETQPDLTESGYYGGYGRPLHRVKSNEEIIKGLKDNKLLRENEKYINIGICEGEDFDAQKIAKACGLNI